MKNDYQQDLFEEDTSITYGSSTENEDDLLEFSDTQGFMKRVESYLSNGSSWYKKLKVDKDMESLDSFGINEISDIDEVDTRSDCSFTNRYEDSLNWEVDNYEDCFGEFKGQEIPCCNKFAPLIQRRNDGDFEFLDPPCIEAPYIGCSSLESKTLIVSSLFIHQSYTCDQQSEVVSYSTMDSTKRVLLIHSKIDSQRLKQCECLMRLALLSSSILYIVVNKEVEDVTAHQIICKILNIAASLTDSFKATMNSSLIRIPDIRVLFCRSGFVLDHGLTNRVEYLHFAYNFVWNEWIDNSSHVNKQIVEGSLREIEKNSFKLFSMVSNFVNDYFGNFNSIYSLVSSFTSFDSDNIDMIIAQTAITTAKIMTKVKELTTKKEIENKNTIAKIECESRINSRKKDKELEKLKKQLNEFKKNFYSTIDLTEKVEKKQETRVIDLSSHLIGNLKNEYVNCMDHEEKTPTNYFFHPYVYVIDKFRIYDELRKSKNYRVKRYKDGSKYEGEYRNHMRQGLGAFLNEHGNIYTGSWLDNERQGYGMQEYSEGNKYCGQWRNDLKHGHGTSWYKDGGVFTGEYLDGLRTGKGIYTYPSGNQYDGEWKNGVRNGFGIYRYCSGEEYYGDWVNDLRTGFGTYIGSDGSKYEGEWYQGLKQGEGKLVTGDQTYRGPFVGGKKHGKGKIVFNNAKGGEDPFSYEGSFLEDEMEGEGQYFLKSGDVLRVIVSKGFVKLIAREVCTFKSFLMRACLKSTQEKSFHFVDIIIK